MNRAIFRWLDDLKTWSDAAARLCARDLLDGDIEYATKFAERFERYEWQINALRAEPPPAVEVAS